MKRFLSTSTLVIALVCIVSTGYPISVCLAAGSQASAIEPAAMTELNKMGAYLRTLKVFQINAVTTTDDVADDGQVIEAGAVWDILARTPDRLRLELKSDDQHRFYFYNGKTVTIFAEVANFYATVPAPPTITQLHTDLYEKYNIELPLSDLFYWGTSHSNSGQITSARDYGPSTIGGVTCEQYGFRQPGVDWQVWIQAGDYPLPRKLVITTTSDAARPRHSAVLTWNLAPSFNEATFDFQPPSDAHRITLAASTPAPGAATK